MTIDPRDFRIVAYAVSPSPNGTFSTYLAAQLLNHAFVPSLTYVPPATIYAAVYTIPPTPAGGGSEITGDPSYVRQSVSFGPASGAPASLNNTSRVMWAAATVDWGQITAIGLHDQLTTGNLLAYGLLLAADGVTPQPKSVLHDDTFMINTGALIVGLG